MPRLAELRLQALEVRVEADLHLGGHAEVIAELRRLAAAHPLRERLHALLMLALYRCGRQAEALAAYRMPARVLVEELGAEPGPSSGNCTSGSWPPMPALAAPEPARLTTASASGSCAAAAARRRAHFTGRAQELAALTALLDQAGADSAGTVVISAIGGTAGVGKTALAVRWAHQVADRFPDGQLYVNLRGYDPDRPVPAADALAGFLRALGVPGQDIPAGDDERAARYRSLLAGRRMLVLLDNAEIGGAGPAAAARQPRLPGAGDQPRRAGRAGRPGRRPPAGPGPAAPRGCGRACCAR